MQGEGKGRKGEQAEGSTTLRDEKREANLQAQIKVEKPWQRKEFCMSQIIEEGGP